MHVCIYIYIYMYMHVCIYIYIYMYMHVCIYIYIYIMFVYTYAYIHNHTLARIDGTNQCMCCSPLFSCPPKLVHINIYICVHKYTKRWIKIQVRVLLHLSHRGGDGKMSSMMVHCFKLCVIKIILSYAPVFPCSPQTRYTYE